MIVGWLMLFAAAFILNLLPFLLLFIIIGSIINYCFKGADKDTISERDVIVYDFDTFPVDDSYMYEPTEPLKPTVPDNIIEDSISVLVNLRTNKGLAKQAVAEAIENGATTIEEIIKQSLQLLNSHR